MDVLERIAVALERNNELLEAAAEGRERVLKSVETATTAKPKATAAKVETKAETPAKAESAPAPKTETAGDDLVAAAVNAYMEGTEGDERAARKAKVAEIFAAVGAKKRSEIPADKEKAVIKTLEKRLAEGNLIVEEEDSSDDEGDDLLG